MTEAVLRKIEDSGVLSGSSTMADPSALEARVEMIGRDVSHVLCQGRRTVPKGTQLLKELEGYVTNLGAVIWALNFAGLLADESGVKLSHTFRDAMLELACAKDHELYQMVRGCTFESVVAPEPPPEGEPTIVLDLPDMCVVHKPPGWEVDSEDVGTGLWLSLFLQSCYPLHEFPIVHYEEHQFGIVHRLDRVSSGLLLVGKTFKGYHALGWQLNSNKIEREYVVLVHGWVDVGLRLIDEKVLHVHAEGQKESTVTEQGKPSKTHLTTLGHYRLSHDESEKLTLTLIQIVTGRRHQIRTHLAHVGHPTVTDGKYMSREPFIRDKQWCCRNFLHRHRLGFCDSSGVLHAAVAPLPADLRSALTYLIDRKSVV